jgi:Domain of unknown function (DUF4114)
MKDIYLNQTTQASLAKSISNLNDATNALVDEYVLKGLKDYEQVKVNLDSSGFNGLLELTNATTGQPIVTQNKNNSVLAFTALPNTNYVIRVTGKDANITGDYVLNTSSDGTTTASSNTITQVNSTAPSNVMTITDKSIAQAGGSSTGEKSAAASASTLVSSAPSKEVVAPSLISPIALSASTGNLNLTTVAPTKSSLPVPPIALNLPTVSSAAAPTIGVNPPATIDTPATPPVIPAMSPAPSISAPPVLATTLSIATPSATGNKPAISPAASPTLSTSNPPVGSAPATTPVVSTATPSITEQTTPATSAPLATSNKPAASTATSPAASPALPKDNPTIGRSPVTTPAAIATTPAVSSATPAVSPATPLASTATTPAASSNAVGNTPAKIPAIPPSLAIANPSAATTATNTNPVTTSTSNPAPIGNAITPNATSATFTVGTNNLLNIQNAGAIQFTAGVSSAAFKNEMGAFIVDDEQGRINGILPGAAGYLAAAMSKSQVIGAGSRPLDFPAGSRLGFYLVQNGTTAQVKADLAAGKTSTLPVFFQTGNTDGSEHLKITQSGNNVTFAWEDTIGGGDRDFNDLVVNATLPVNTPLSTANAPGALSTIDLRDISGVRATSVTVGGSSSYDNFIGFYRVDDASGKIDTFNPGDAGYAQAALGRNVILYNKTAGNATPSIEGGGILAPYAIANGTPQSFLDRNPTNQGSGNLPHAYFAFIGANPDKVQHIQLLGDNKFGFEDTFGGGDRDFNDVTAQIRVTT